MPETKLEELLAQLEQTETYLGRIIEKAKTLKLDEEKRGFEEFERLSQEVDDFLATGGSGLYFHTQVESFIRNIRRFISPSLNEKLVRKGLELILRLSDGDPEILKNIIRLQQFSTAAIIARLMLRELDFPGSEYDPYAEAIEEIRTASNYKLALRGAYNVLEIGIMDPGSQQDLSDKGQGVAPSKSFEILNDLCSEDLPDHIILAVLTVVLRETSPDHAVVVLETCFDNLIRLKEEAAIRKLTIIMLDLSSRLGILELTSFGLLRTLYRLPDAEDSIRIRIATAFALKEFDPASVEYENDQDMNNVSHKDYLMYYTLYCYCQNNKDVKARIERILSDLGLEN